VRIPDSVAGESRVSSTRRVTPKCNVGLCGKKLCPMADTAQIRGARAAVQRREVEPDRLRLNQIPHRPLEQLGVKLICEVCHIKMVVDRACNTCSRSRADGNQLQEPQSSTARRYHVFHAVRCVKVNCCIVGLPLMEFGSVVIPLQKSTVGASDTSISSNSAAGSLHRGTILR
jgi:hypothetical protein